MGIDIYLSVENGLEKSVGVFRTLLQGQKIGEVLGMVTYHFIHSSLFLLNFRT